MASFSRQTAAEADGVFSAHARWAIIIEALY